MRRIFLALLVIVAVSAITSAQQTMQFVAPTKSTAAWTSATTNNTALTVTTTDLSQVVVTLNATSTMTAGGLNFEVDDGSGTWWAIPCTRAAGASVSGANETTFTLSVTTQAWTCEVSGWTSYRVRLNPVISGTGTATVAILPTAAPLESSTTIVQPAASALNATVIGNQTPGDAASNPTDALHAESFNMCWNGSTWDRCKTGTTGAGTTDTGTARVTLATNDGLIGSAGSGSTEVLTVQGNASGTPVPVSGTVTVTQSTASNLKATTTSTNFPSTVTLNAGAADASTLRTAADLREVGGSALSLGQQLAAASIPVILPSATITALTPPTSVGLNAGSNIVGKVGIDQTTPGTTNGVQVNAALPAGSNTIGKVGIDQTTPGTTNAVAATNFPTTVDTNAGSPGASTVRTVLADGLTECNFVSAASTNATSCKGSAGQWFGIDVYNTTTTTYYLRLYNTSTAPTCSSATGFIKSIPIPAAVAAGTAGGVVRVLPIGVSYGTGIGFCITGGSSSTDNTNAAVGLFGTVYYR